MKSFCKFVVWTNFKLIAFAEDASVSQLLHLSFSMWFTVALPPAVSKCTSVQVWQCVYFPRVQGDFGTVPLTSDSIVTFTPCSICIQASHWRRMFRRFTLRAFPVLGHLRPDIQKRSVRRGRRKNWPNDDNRNLLIRSHCWEREFNTPPLWSLRACPGCEPNLR